MSLPNDREKATITSVFMVDYSPKGPIDFIHETKINGISLCLTIVAPKAGFRNRQMKISKSS